MTRRASHPHLVIASLLSLLLVAVTAVPASAGEPRRVRNAEDLAYKLVNCLRTGGKVTTGGKCKGYGTGKYSSKRVAFKRSKRISGKVSWPWAKRTVKANICGHTLAGSTVDKRFRSAGLGWAANGENIGCSWGWTTKRMVKTMMRWWQNEKSYNGSHWRQIKSKKFKSVGVAVSRLPNGRSRLVVNFFGKPIG